MTIARAVIIRTVTWLTIIMGRVNANQDMREQRVQRTCVTAHHVQTMARANRKQRNHSMNAFAKVATVAISAKSVLQLLLVCFLNEHF